MNQPDPVSAGVIDIATPRIDTASRIVLAPSRLSAQTVHYFHVEAPAEGITQLPASPFPILTVFVSGAVLFATEQGRWLPAPAAFVGGPFSRPLRYRALPGTVFATALLRPGQMQRLFGLPQNRLVDVCWPLEDLVERDCVERLIDEARGCIGAPALAELLGAWLDTRMRSAPAAATWLDPSLIDGTVEPGELARQHGISLRQFERRFIASYGLSLRQMRRLARFVHVLSGVMAGRHGVGGFTRLAQEYGYFDQAHLTRDFVDLAGTTPGRLVQNAAYDREWSMFSYSRPDLDMMIGREREEPLLYR